MNKVLNIIKKKKLIILFIVLILIIGILLLTIPKVKKGLSKAQENGIVANTNEGIIKEEEYEGIKFSNISMLSENGKTTFTADVTNISDKKIDKERLHISIKDGDGKEVVKYLAYFPGGLKKKETKTITAIAEGNYTEAKTKEIME